MEAKSKKNEENFKNNKKDYESTVRVGRYLYEYILKTHFETDDKLMTAISELKSNKQKTKNFNEKELSKLQDEVTCDNLLECDETLLHKLVYYLCELENSDPACSKHQLQTNLKNFKDNHRHDYSHPHKMSAFTDLYTWEKIEEVKVLFQIILDGIKDVYHIDVHEKNKEISKKVDGELSTFLVSVTNLEIGILLNKLQDIGVEKCPSRLMIVIEKNPKDCTELLPLLHTIAKQDTSVTFLVNKAYFGDKDVETQALDFYDSEKYLGPLIDKDSKCELTWYRGNLSNEMIALLPPSLKQLYVRMTLDQVQHLKDQLPKLIELWSLGLYLDFGKKDDCSGFNDIDPSTLPQLGYKGKQLGLRFHGSIAIENIDVVVKIIEGLTKDHQCDTLEFYNTHLNTAEEIEALLNALHGTGIHVTTWLKLQNQESEKDIELEANLNDLAKTLNIKQFKFLNPVSL